MKNGFPGLLIPIGAFFLFILLSSSCEQTAKNGSSQTVSDSLEAILLQRLDRYYSDLSSRNWDAYADHFWPGSRLTTVWQPPDADSLQLLDKIKQHGQRNTAHVAEVDDLAAAVKDQLQPGDLVLTLGAGNIYRAGEELLTLLEEERN